ncbi:MmgE/PrpD family protein [Rosenbergiella nectarea]|uniref:MmgE/PrpD family protein n=1 Tax=Rosenbergiella nectarea TaxID=988801 RepID=UPI001F4D3FF6|nr:MmgE/PrpD family protein [Rosenbergiella nectarea]
MDTSLTGKFAAILFTYTPTAEERSAARRGVKDYLASTLPVFFDAVPDNGKQSLLNTFSPDNSVENLALKLGYISHALDYDDYHASFRGHPSTVILSSLFALSHALGRDKAEDFLDAYIIGVEAAGRLGRAIGSRHYGMGLHSTATLGPLAATAACCRWLNLSREQTQIALGLAATQSSGLRAQFGSATKPLHSGFAARSAVNSVQLAMANFPGQESGVLESFLSVFGYHAEQPQQLLADWATPWRIIQPGLEFKRYPTCGGTHSAAEAAFVLRQRCFELGVSDPYTAIKRIEVSFPPGADTAPNICHPVDGVQARFSLEYVIADALVNGSLALEHYTAKPVNPTLSALAARVERCPDFSAPADELDPDRRFHRITLFLDDGRQISHCVTRQETAATYTDVDEKLAVSLALLPSSVAEQFSATLTLDSDKQLQQLASLLCS